MKKLSQSLLIALVALALGSHVALANPSEALISQYNQAASGDEELVTPVVDSLTQLIDQQGAEPLTLVYLGSGQTLQGRDAFWPWTQMKLVEKGLATIDKGLNLLSTQTTPVAEQEIIMGLPDSYLARAIAATTYSQLPDMFNHFERGYDLYIGLLEEPYMQQAPFEATAWIYSYAIEAALRAQDIKQAKLWQQVMEKRNPDHMETIKSKSLIDKA